MEQEEKKEQKKENKIVKKVKEGKVTGTFLKYYNYAKERRYDTLAGTLSFFFLLSFIPLLYLCLTLYVKLGEWFGLETPIPEAIQQYVSFDVAAGASILFILTTIYAASKFFLQLKKTGEIAYGISKPKTNIKSTIWSCVLVVVSMLIVALGLLAIALGNRYLGDYVWAKVLIQVLTYLLIGGIFFALMVVINVFACQIELIKIKRLMPGILFSFIFMVILTSFFGLYVGLKDYDTLYGFFSTVIIAAGYVYFLMQGTIIGIIINEYKFTHNEKLRAEIDKEIEEAKQKKHILPIKF